MQQQQQQQQQQLQQQQQQQQERPPAAETRPSPCEIKNESSDTTSETVHERVTKTENYPSFISEFDAGVLDFLYDIDEDKYKQADELYEKRALQHHRTYGIDFVPAFKCSSSR